MELSAAKNIASGAAKTINTECTQFATWRKKPNRTAFFQDPTPTYQTKKSIDREQHNSYKVASRFAIHVFWFWLTPLTDSSAMLDD